MRQGMVGVRAVVEFPDVCAFKISAFAITSLTVLHLIYVDFLGMVLLFMFLS